METGKATVNGDITKSDQKDEKTAQPKEMPQHPHDIAKLRQSHIDNLVSLNDQVYKDITATKNLIAEKHLTHSVSMQKLMLNQQKALKDKLWATYHQMENEIEESTYQAVEKLKLLSETTKADLDDFAFKKITQTQKDIMSMKNDYESKI